MSYFTIDPGADHVVLDPAARTGSVVFSVQNKTGARRRVRALVVTGQPTEQAWYTVREPLREAGVDETIQFQVSVAIPPDAAAGDYTFQLRAVAEDDPDDVYRDSQSLRVQVPEAQQRKPFPWWIIAVAVAVLVVAGVLAFLFTRGNGTDDADDGPFPFGVQRGQTLPLNGTTSAAQPRLEGTAEDETLRNYFVASGGQVLITGVLSDRVVRSAETGTLVFTPRIRQVVDNQSGAVVVGLILSGFAGAAVDVDFRTDEFGNAGPTIVSRSDDGDELRFDYLAAPLASGEVSLRLSLFTEAGDFAPDGTFRIVARTAAGETVTSEPLPLHVPASP